MALFRKLTQDQKSVLCEYMRTGNYLVRKKAHAILLWGRDYEIFQLENIFDMKAADIKAAVDEFILTGRVS